MIAEAIFNSKIRYGIALYLNPVFDEEDLKRIFLSKNATAFQVLQNTMLRIILGLKMKQQANMQKVRQRMKIITANQIRCVATQEALNTWR